MPFRSQAQEKWAFANKMPWADRWAKEAPKGVTLPTHVAKKATADRIKRKLLKNRRK